MEIFVVIIFAIIVALILGILLQDFCDMKLNLIVNNIGINIHALWLYSIEIGGGLLAVCSIIAWIALSGLNRQGNRLAENLRRSRNHLFRNVMLIIQIVICFVFVCGTFILIYGGNKIMKEYNIPDNDSYYKEYLYFEPMYAKEKELLLKEIKRLPNLDNIILCGKSYTSIIEIQESKETIEKLDRHTYFLSYYTDDPILISKLGMNVEWFKNNTNHDDFMVLISDNLYRKFQELGILSNHSLTIEAFSNRDVTFPIAGTIKSIPYDMKNESLVFILPNWEESQFMQFLLVPKPGKGESLARNVDETVELIEPELINKLVSNYRERVSPIPGFIEAVRGGGIILGGVSLLICAMSIFSTIALDSRARRKEIAVRKVNGAKSRDIYRMFGRVYIVMIGISILITVPICVIFNQVVESALVELSPEITLSPLMPIILGIMIVTLLIFSIVGWQIHMTMQVDPSKIIAKE